MKNTILYTGNFNIFNLNAAGKRVLYNCLALQNAGYSILTLGMPPSNEENMFLDGDNNGFENYHYPEKLIEKSRFRVGLLYDYFVDFIKDKLDCIKCIVLYGCPSLSIFNKKVICFARKNGIKVLADVVDWLPSVSGTIFFRTIKRIDNWFLKRVIYSKVDGVIAISPWLVKFYSNIEAKTILIPPLNNTFPNIDVCNKKKTIVYAGIPFRLGKRIKRENELKDRIDKMIVLLSDIEDIDFSFHIFGFTKEQLLHSLPSLSSPILKLGKRITFFGQKDSSFIHNALKEADFTFLLRDNNLTSTAGFPSKVSESLAFNVPIITNKTSNISDYLLDDVECYFLDGLNDKESVEKIKSVLKQDNETLLGKRHIIFERKTFIYNKYSSQLHDFLNSLFNHN